MISPKDIFTEARAAGSAAVAVCTSDSTLNSKVWVNIAAARGPFVKFLKQSQIGQHDSLLGGYTLYSYECCDYRGECEDTKIAAVAAFNQVLASYNIDASIGSSPNLPG